MFETFGFETLTPRQASIWFGLALGLAFGALAEVSRFCLRRGLVPGADRHAALATWLVALAVALLAMQLLPRDLIALEEHRLHAASLPVLAITLGGLMFGAGMALTRGCISRLTVLTGSGNLRALSVLLVVAIFAHATMKGLLAPLRTGLSSVTVPTPTLPGPGLAWAFVVAVLIATLAWRVRAPKGHLLAAALIGLLIPVGWVGTGFVLFDEFDPIAMDSLSFTRPLADSLFWSIASSAVPAGFGIGLLGGTLAGAALLAILSGRFQWQSFESPAQTGRYLAGGALMGMGGVLAGGCTVGAGLSGVSTLSAAAILGLGTIMLGGWATGRLLSDPSTSGSAAPSATPEPQLAG
ncbi:YeeE/YedE thiosulfate transporter family protein [Aliiroseovarius sp.]|uniref:YeeE/YedE thiosulfate transporter family protein n=1 Tax=Aliiroseovarius sp. TaxID=1872442 RepID=UPI003BAAABC5